MWFYGARAWAAACGSLGFDKSGFRSPSTHHAQGMAARRAPGLIKWVEALGVQLETLCCCISIHDLSQQGAGRNRTNLIESVLSNVGRKSCSRRRKLTHNSPALWCQSLVLDFVLNILLRSYGLIRHQVWIVNIHSTLHLCVSRGGDFIMIWFLWNKKNIHYFFFRQMLRSPKSCIISA